MPLPTLSLAAAVGVSAVLPQTLAEIAANAALTSATAVTVQTSVTSNPVTTADGSATGNTVAAHLSVAANYNGGNNQVAVGNGRFDHGPGDHAHRRRAGCSDAHGQGRLPARERVAGRRRLRGSSMPASRPPPTPCR